MQQIKPQMNRGRFLPNLSEKELTIILPMKKPAKMTEVETNPKEPRSHTSSNCEKKNTKENKKKNIKVDFKPRGLINDED